ncbi:MAG: GTPase HflX [Candidatus Eisenbacteria bacterium]|nr:GTPase HflX [Candidatus Eisenbacteria bacterium]
MAAGGSTEPAPETAVLVGVGLPADTAAAVTRSLDELAELARTAGAEVVGRFTQRRTRVEGATYIGKGKLEELTRFVEERKARLVLFDNDLSPAQARNLEKELRVKVIDRSELILHIFSIHARTDMAKLQVELAQLEYAMPRLRRLWAHLSRLGGGIGTRGPGETQLEVDRRRVRERIHHLKQELKRFDTCRDEQRKARAGKEVGVALVGYTNAGKSTLLNRLAGSDVEAEDFLFCTLDTTSRVVDLDRDYRIVLSDTVGFIRKLPHGLVASFRATLSEVRHADLLIHVVDASNEDAEAQIEAVHGVLEELGAAEKPTILVLNKEDAVTDTLALNRLADQHGPALSLSARTGAGTARLLDEIRREVASMRLAVDLVFPATASAEAARVHREGEVLDVRYEEETIHIRARLPVSLLERLRKKGYVRE